MSVQPVLDHIDAALDPAIERLTELLRLPSISTDPAYHTACVAAADWLVADLVSMGAQARRVDTEGKPFVVGHIGEGAPHLVFYGHYDVQPADPLALWDGDPFEPAIVEGRLGRVIRARGATDDKGQLMTFVEACRSWLAVHGALPCRITFFFEGEEESGSPSLPAFLEAHGEEISGDLCLACDTDLFDDDTPAITTMLRGMLGEEITIHGPDVDLHSGSYGGPAINPIRVLSQIIAGLHDETGRVTVPGFYDGVPEVPETLRAQWEGLGFDAARFLGEVGLSHPAGEQDRSVLEMIWARPTCEVNGITGGYSGAGFKTVLPAEASAKISFRLVGTQDPHAICAAFRAQVEAALPPDCTVTFTNHGASTATVMATDDPAFEAARQALSLEWPKPAAFIGSGGSIPIVGDFQTHLGMPSMLIGFRREDDRMHSPNEKYDIESFHRGIRSWARILDALT